jgi:hypothetical protein
MAWRHQRTDPGLVQALDVTEACVLERGPVVAGTSCRQGQPLHIDVRRRMKNYLFLPVMAPCAKPRALKRSCVMSVSWPAGKAAVASPTIGDAAHAGLTGWADDSGDLWSSEHGADPVRRLPPRCN